MTMMRTILIHGLYAGLILGLFAAVTAMTGPPPEPWGMIVGYLAMLIALSMVFVGIKRHRDLAAGGVIGFWSAFGFGLAISLVAGILYVIAWEIALPLSGADFIGDYSRQVIADMRAKGASAERIAKVSADMAKFREDYANPLFRIPMTFLEITPPALLVSLVSAGLLRNPRFLPMRRG
jgi:hypothetical protein